LTLLTGFTVGGGDLRHDVPIRVEIFRNNALAGDPSDALAGTDGEFHSTLLWPASDDQILIQMRATIQDGITFSDDLQIGTTARSSSTTRPADSPPGARRSRHIKRRSPATPSRRSVR
jgi:hypothetical protein